MKESKFNFSAEIFPQGTLISNRYEVIEHIGAGNVGLVLKAKDTQSEGKVVAIKILHPELGKNSVSLKRFQNEVSATRLFDHPNIVKSYELNQSGDDFYYFAMEYVEGTSLRKYLDSKPTISFEQKLTIFLQILQGTAHAHQLNIIHRDIKPDNILITPDLQIKITDFGIAKFLESSLNLTRTGEGVGTPEYIAPEQFNASKADKRSDVYSLSILGYELMVGALPFHHTTMLGMAAHHYKTPIPPFAKKKSIPTWYERLIFKAGQKQPIDRFQDADEMLSEANLHATSKKITFMSIIRRYLLNQ